MSDVLELPDQKVVSDDCGNQVWVDLITMNIFSFGTGVEPWTLCHPVGCDC